MQTVIHATQKDTAIDQQQHSCETLICQHHQTIVRLLSSAVTASTRWRVYELYCQTTYTIAVCTVKNPDDGQRNCLKHVEFHFKNKI